MLQKWGERDSATGHTSGALPSLWAATSVSLHDRQLPVCLAVGPADVPTCLAGAGQHLTPHSCSPLLPCSGKPGADDPGRPNSGHSLQGLHSPGVGRLHWRLPPCAYRWARRFLASWVGFVCAMRVVFWGQPCGRP